MKTQDLQFDDICRLLDADSADELYALADNITRETKGNLVNVRAIIEFSNYCNRNCSYCGLNCHNTTLGRYRMTPEEIIATALESSDAGYKTVVIQGGEDPLFTADIYCDIIKEIKSKRDIAITLSVGEMSEDAYAAIRMAGCDRYLLKHETTDEEIYSKLHPGYSLDNRLNCLRTLKRLGYETGGGFMIGLPEQTTETIANDLLFIKSVPCDMAGIGPFIPHPETPLKESEQGSTELTRRAVAIARVLLPNINLPATTSLGVIDKNERNKVFSGGANVIMKKVTPEKYRELYEIYPVNHGKIKSIADERAEINELLASIGKEWD